jgi:hypothetical protein
MLTDSKDGALLVWCFGGCDARDVFNELRRRGLLDARGWNDMPLKPIAARQNETARGVARTERALMLWREAQPVVGSIIEKYLEGRGICLRDVPVGTLGKIRFHPFCPHPSGARLPVMMALVEHVESGQVGIHRTFLKADGSGKANVEPEKASLGPVGGGAIRFGLPQEGGWLAISEGIETGLSVLRACAIPTWAALSAGGIEKLILPPTATMVVICADADKSGVGQRAANNAAQRFLSEARRVRIAVPPLGCDFNDVLLEKTSARTEEKRHVA